VSAKILVVGENRQIKRTLALTLVLKQVYEWHVYMSSVRDGLSLISGRRSARPAHKSCVPRATVYQHHIEPRIEKLTIADSPWLAYLDGYGPTSSL
jgi:hypothetical protein